MKVSKLAAPKSRAQVHSSNHATARSSAVVWR